MASSSRSLFCRVNWSGLLAPSVTLGEKLIPLLLSCRRAALSRAGSLLGLPGPSAPSPHSLLSPASRPLQAAAPGAHPGCPQAPRPPVAPSASPSTRVPASRGQGSCGLALLRLLHLRTLGAWPLRVFGVDELARTWEKVPESPSISLQTSVSPPRSHPSLSSLSLGSPVAPPKCTWALI